MVHLCAGITNNTMRKLKSKIESEQSSFHTFIGYDLEQHSFAEVLSMVQPLFMATILGAWIYTCTQYANDYTSTAITCSLIFMCLSFFRNAEQKGHFNRKK